MRARRSRSEWSSIIKAFKKAGGSHEEFCRERGLNLGSFRGWLYRLQRKETSAPEVALVPVTVTGVTSLPAGEVAGTAAEIVVAVASMDVRVAPGTDVAYVAALVAELRARC
jgi:hypothetical protein